MIFTVLRDLCNEDVKRQRRDPMHHHPVKVTFGISASKQLKAVNNVARWGMSIMSKTYNGLAFAGGLLKRGEFRVSKCRAFFTLYV